jgi:hypothetical protein
VIWGSAGDQVVVIWGSAGDQVVVIWGSAGDQVVVTCCLSLLWCSITASVFLGLPSTHAKYSSFLF